MQRLQRVLEEARAQRFEIEEAHGNTWITLPRDGLVDRMAHYKTLGFNYLADIIGIDYLTYPDPKPERFCVVYELVSLPGWKDGDGSRFFVRVYVPEANPVLPTVTGIWGSANWLEREIYDLFGIRFEGHPDLRKILTPEDLDGHPLRKDFPLGETPTLFKEGRFIDPAAFRAGLTGKDPGLTGWRGGTRKGYQQLFQDVRRAAELEKEGE
ncbi:NADH-quinone oxidoreductase subunit C [Marinithermus hydrothermalis]|uniref:NADH-quinone oxidoreductase subunit C n=1 Tax=Marinithermus hydrothermalis (strain DSM 14884 / JCM 11576 / T1) TaxID=869210 RepID=F2NM01_MARHT|nr:NADH-quinone oxidoreductase subunit C [Marinithermus hydrothermalis]AEB11258.1 NAD(P)H-quinone oxidoreductase subunit J [Marinithermus hydrothermalis DSM 14884]